MQLNKEQTVSTSWDFNLHPLSSTQEFLTLLKIGTSRLDSLEVV